MTSVSYEVPLVDEPVSPELALVDPELAARLRALMPVPDIELEPRRTNVRHLRLTPPPAEEPAETPTQAAVVVAPAPRVPPPQGSVRRLVAAFVAGAAVAALVTVGVVARLDESELPRESSPVSVPPVVRAPSVEAPKPAAAAAGKTPTPTTKAKPKPNPKPKTQPTAEKPRSQSATPKPATGGRVAPAATPEPRRFAWAPVEGAVGYRVELFRGDKQVLRATTKDPTFALGPTWRHGGRVERLTPGSYRWYVWPVLPDGAADQAIVQAKLSVP